MSHVAMDEYRLVSFKRLFDGLSGLLEEVIGTLSAIFFGLSITHVEVMVLTADVICYTVLTDGYDHIESVSRSLSCVLYVTYPEIPGYLIHSL